MSFLRRFFAEPSKVKLLLLSGFVGIGGAIGAMVFHFLIYLCVWLFFGSTNDSEFISTLESLPSWYRVLIPTFGGLLIGLIYWLSKISEVEGEGVPEVIEALAIKHGNIRPWVGPLKIVTSAITIGSGGSAGREGPVIQIGSAIGSNLGQFLNLDTKQTSMLLASGAAAAIAATFGTPLAGVIFCVEVLIKKISTFNYSQLLIAAIVGSWVAQLLVGHRGLTLIVREVSLIEPFEVITYIGLGLISGLIAVAFGRSMKLSSGLFNNLSIPRMYKPALGGFLIGLLALFIPQIHEPAAYPIMVDILNVTSLPILFLLLLLLAKILSTSITLGSGGSGGIFAPSLLIGIILGSTFSSFLQYLGVVNIDTYVYALVGMAAVFAAVVHAPFTAIIILFEMTNEYLLLIPLTISCLTATYVSKKLNHDSIYKVH